MTDPGNLRDALNCYLNEGKRHPRVDEKHAAMIGYCFGGTACFEAVRGGLELDAVCSFHGVLQSRPQSRNTKQILHPNKHNTKTIVLVENGNLDPFVTPNSKQKFFEEMDEAGVDWRFHDHSRTPASAPMLFPLSFLFVSTLTTILILILLSCASFIARFCVVAWVFE